MGKMFVCFGRLMDSQPKRTALLRHLPRGRFGVWCGVCVCVLFFEVASGIWVRAKVFLTRAAVVGVVHWLLVVGVRLVAEDTRPEYRDSKWCFRSRS